MCAKALVAAPTFGEYILRTAVTPAPSDERYALVPFCAFPSREACTAGRGGRCCERVHYKRMLQTHTDATQGDCSYLDTCRHLYTCKFVHYMLDTENVDPKALQECESLKHRLVNVNAFDVTERLELEVGEEGKETWFEKGVIREMDRPIVPPQWIRCDMRSLDLGIFRGLVSVVMADPPWDIRMDLPYGTMTDHEMKSLRVDLIQDEGLLFLWVTGRAMEIARDCMTAWGYRRVDEIVWVKTNHLHRIIRTGRTGHWLNHSKEHCLVGIKGNPKINAQIECDVIVSEVRETSRKPDEIYRMIERISPSGLKLELFGRQHNLRENWITLGNQLDGATLHTPQLVKAFREHPAGMRQVCFEEAERLRNTKAKK